VIWFVLEGERVLTVQNRKYRIKRGDLIVIPPSTSFSIFSDQDRLETMHYLSIGCDWKVGSFHFVDLFHFPKVCHFHDASDIEKLQAAWLELLGIWNQFINEVTPEFAAMSRTLKKRSFFSPKIEIQTNQSGLFLFMIGCFYRWAAVLLQLTQSEMPPLPKQPDVRIEKVCNFVNDHYGNPLTMNDLCETVYMSDSHLRNLFKKNLDMSPMHYVQKVRLEKAKELLIETAEPVSHIAQAVGYSDVGYFSRVFRKMERMTPVEYRKEMSSF
jgi:AraC-like DNA-binding protein